MDKIISKYVMFIELFIASIGIILSTLEMEVFAIEYITYTSNALVSNFNIQAIGR